MFVSNTKCMTQKKQHSLLEKALYIATYAHKGQIDKGGAPYINHPIRVANKCISEEEKIVAYLHDVIEDTNVTTNDLLLQGFSPKIVEAVLSVTRKEDETYEDFIKRCGSNTIGRQVKIHDLEDNMDTTRLKTINKEDTLRVNKYKKAYDYLTSLKE